MSLLQKLFDNNEREVAKYRRKVDQINALEEQMQRLTDAELRAKTNEFREKIAAALAAELERREMVWEEMDKEQRRLASDAVLDPILVEVFAVVREASKRTIGMRHFDVQLIGGMVTHDGRVSELKTGEGKTLMATLPLYLNALLGKGAHLVTPNDYLSKFGAVSMGPLYHFLGMTVGIIQGASAETGDIGGTFQYDPGYRDPDPRYDYARPLVRREESYQCDITYGTNNEYGFDYLRDNLAHSLEDLSQRDLFFAIVDEADSILIDEARTPLIISGPMAESSDLYVKLDRIIRYLQEERDYTIDEKVKTAMFTEEGQDRVEKALGIDNLSDAENIALMQHAMAALKAHTVYKKDIDYVLKFNDQKGVNEVIIVDEFTGRLMFGRRWGDGLHQAVEAKEGVKIESESRTYATITFQNYFRLYTKLSGMTGTAKTEEEELRKVYALDVVVVPTNKPMVRLDQPDIIYKTQEAKLRGIAQEILRVYAKQQPVLVGTRNIEMSERVSARLNYDKLELLAMIIVLRDKIENAKGLDKSTLTEWNGILNQKIDTLTLAKLAPIARHLSVSTSPRASDNLEALAALLSVPIENHHYLQEALQHGIPHNVLNAKYHEKEAHIIAEAGRKGAVTIATNMAGRGVDIILGGTMVPHEEEEEATADGQLSYRRGGRPEDNIRMRSLQEQESDTEHKTRADEVRGLGGLFIIGTERHESRRIDNQLRGRGGRQGDPGESRFFVSLEDELWRIFGDKSQSPFLQGWSEEQAIDAKILSKMIERAQKKVEMHNFDSRKHVLEYDDVMNTQRTVIYGQRRQLLEGVDLRNTMVTYLTEVVQGDLDVYCPEGVSEYEQDINGLYNSLNQTFPLQLYISSADELKGKKREELEKLLVETAQHAYDEKEENLSPEITRDVERHWTMVVLDRHWMEHLSNMEYLREGINWRGYSGVDPLVQYKKEAFDTFQDMLGGLQEGVIRLVFNTQLVPQPTPVHSGLTTNQSDGEDDGDEGEEAPQLQAVGRAAPALAGAGLGTKPKSSSGLRKVGRNDPCPCGSGKKYKVCHGR